MPYTREDVAKRRAERQKKIRIKRLKIAFVLFMIAALITVAILCVTVFFPINTITVSGSELYTANEIIEAGKIGESENLLTVSNKKICERLRKKLPYVDSVELKRDFPDRLVLKITDAKEYACYKVSNKYYAVSDKDYVLNSYNQLPENTFEINAKGLKCKAGEKIEFTDKSLKDMIDSLCDSLQSRNIKIDSIDVTDKYNINARVEGRFNVILGAQIDLDKKCAHLAGMIASIEQDATGTINLSMWTTSKSEGTFIKDKN